MELLREGLWHWSAAHPAWTPADDWPRDVRCFAHLSRDGLLLVDPLLEDRDWGPVDRLAEAHGAPVAVLVTVRWHARDAGAAARRYGAELYAPRLGKEQESLADARPIEEGAPLPGGLEAIVVPKAAEALLYLPDARTLVAGDVLLARDGQLSPLPRLVARERGGSRARAGRRAPRSRAAARGRRGLPRRAGAVRPGRPRGGPRAEARAQAAGWRSRTRSNASSARSRCSRSCVAITLVRSSAPPRGTAG